MSCNGYKSPTHKLIKFFEKSRDSWEKKAKERREEIRDLQARIRDLEASRDQWKEKTKTTTEQNKLKEAALRGMQKALIEAQAAQVLLQQECEELKKKLKHS